MPYNIKMAITRETLKDMYRIHVTKDKEPRIQTIVDYITSCVVAANERGDNTYKYVIFDKLQDTPEVMEEVVRRLAAVFVDSKVEYICHACIRVDWSDE